MFSIRWLTRAAERLLKSSAMSHGFALVPLSLLLTACGGGTGPSTQVERPPGVKVVLGTPPDAPAPALTFRFNYPQDAVETEDGTIYVAETQSHVVRRIRDGLVEVYAGTLQPGFNGDGDRRATQLRFPTAITHRAGELVVADASNFVVRSINVATGQVKVIAGTPGQRGWPSPEREATQTTIEYVSWLGFDASGLLWAAMSSATGLEPPRLYWLEPTSRQWRRFDLPDFVTSGVEISGVWVDVGIGVDLLETGGRFLRLTTYSASSRGMSSRFIGGIYRDEAGRTFLGDHTSILMLAADGSEIGRLPRQFANVTSIKRSPSGGLLVVDSDEGRIFRITTTGDVIWSTGTSPSALGVVVSVAQSGGRLLALDNAKPAIIAVDRDGNSSRIAGNGRLAWADISVDAAQTGFLYPSALAADSRGNIFVAEQHRIMRIDASSRQVSLFCGYETAGNIYDAPCATARFNGIRGLAFDSQDRLYVADTYNNQIKRVSVDGSLVELIAGNGLGRTFAELSPRFDVDARQSPLNRPHAVRVSPAGRILVADSWNNAVYSLDQGMLRPFAGVPGHAPQWNELNAPYQGQGEYAGDGGPAASAKLNTPSDLAFCPDGGVLIADEFNFAIRRVSTDGRISTVFGGTQGYSADGSRVSFLHSVACDASGFFVADVGNALVFRVEPNSNAP